jgi:hypothetical protein
MEPSNSCVETRCRNVEVNIEVEAGNESIKKALCVQTCREQASPGA